MSKRASPLALSFAAIVAALLINATYGFFISDSSPTINGMTATGNQYGVYYEKAGG